MWPDRRRLSAVESAGWSAVIVAAEEENFYSGVYVDRVHAVWLYFFSLTLLNLFIIHYLHYSNLAYSHIHTTMSPPVLCVLLQLHSEPTKFEGPIVQEMESTSCV